MPRSPLLAIVVLVLLAVSPIALAAWTTSASVPPSFRPERSVTFSYSASSSVATDVPIQWRVTLYTCQDLDANTWCEAPDAHRVDHGIRALNVVGGASQVVTWSVSLPSPEGNYRYHFDTVCANNPCTGFAAGGAHNKTGAFLLAYTDTWSRRIIATDPTSVGATETIQYRLASSSVDDRDLSGIAQLFSTPEDMAEREHGTRAIDVLAGQEQTLSWAGVDFPEIGTQHLRVADTTTQEETTLDIAVRGVHLHVHQPRDAYPAGSSFGLYFTLEGHGADPDPFPIANAEIRLDVRNGSFVVASATIRTDAAGRAYANVTTAHDAQTLSWAATTSGSWMGTAYALSQGGTVLLSTGDHAALDENLTAIREGLDDMRLRGVHLDELGSRNAWMTSVRAAGAVALVILLILLVVFISFRV